MSNTFGGGPGEIKNSSRLTVVSELLVALPTPAEALQLMSTAPSTAYQQLDALAAKKAKLEEELAEVEKQARSLCAAPRGARAGA